MHARLFAIAALVKSMGSRMVRRFETERASQIYIHSPADKRHQNRSKIIFCVIVSKKMRLGERAGRKSNIGSPRDLRAVYVTRKIK